MMAEGAQYRRGMARYLLVALACAVTVALLCGCLAKYSRPGGVRPSYLAMRDGAYDIQGEVSGESSSFNLLWLIPVTPEISFDAAMQDAIRSKGGDNLIDVRWEWEQQHWIVGTVTVLTVRGKVISYRED